MLKTIFDLPKSKDELESANNGFASWKWIQKAPLRDVVDTNTNPSTFSRGNIVFRWDLASSTYFMPSYCFVRMRCELTKRNTNNINGALDKKEGIAPAMNLIPNLLTECSLTMQDQQVSICDRHCGEVDMMYRRLNKSGQSLRDCGNSLNFTEANLQKRMKEICDDSWQKHTHGYASKLIDTLRPAGVDTLVNPATLNVTITNVVSFTANPAGRPIPDLRNVLKVGDQFRLNTGANANIIRNITNVTANSITLDGAPLAAEVATNVTDANAIGSTGWRQISTLFATGQRGSEAQPYDEIQILYDANLGNRLRFSTNGQLSDTDLANYFQIGDIVYIYDGADNYRRIIDITHEGDYINNGDSLYNNVLVLDGAPLTPVASAAFSSNHCVQRSCDIKVMNPQELRKITDFEINWMPRCLSFFRLPHSMPGGCKYEFILNPKNLYKIAAVESLINKSPTDDYDFKVKSLFFYVPTFEGQSIIEKDQFYLDLNEIRAQKISITTQESSYSLDIRPSTNALAVAVQSGSVENRTDYSASKFIAENDYQNKLTSMHVRYGSEQKPIPNFDINFSENINKNGERRIDHWNEVYLRNLLASGAYFDSSCEKITEYYERGQYIYQVWNRSGDDRETRVYVTLRFSEQPPENPNPSLVLFNFYKKYGICKYSNGRLVEILINEA